MTSSHRLCWIVCLISFFFQVIVEGSTTPVITSPNGKTYVSENNDDGYFRNILVDDSGEKAYIGGKNRIYGIDLSGDEQPVKVSPPSNKQKRPNFREAETQVGTDYDENSDVYKTLERFFEERQPIQLVATEKLSQVYKLPNVTFGEQCRRQIKILQLYYGRHLQLPLDDPDMVCSQHNQGLTWLNKAEGKMFSLRNGIFGTMPVGLTGVTDFDKGWPKWLEDSAALALPNITASAFKDNRDKYYEKMYNANRTCYKCGYSQESGECIFDGLFTSIGGPKEICYREYAIPNYMSTNYFCDSSPNPARVVTNVNSMTIEKDGPLPATSKDSCPNTNIASTLMSGFHPDQTTKTITSVSGNGPHGGGAIYILTEIGQEKQLDVNHDSFMGYEEPVPLSSSASLALVRLLIKDGEDVSSDDIVVSNPFKETWVTSPLSRYGRLMKTGNQATVPHRPRAIDLFEDDNFVYFFFREVEWESMLQPEYSINRYHFLWKSYDRTVSYPWEKEKSGNRSYIKQFERTKPEQYMRHTTSLSVPKFRQLQKEYNAFVYAPSLDAFNHGWQNAKMVTRVSRVCKNDAGLPLGVQDASVFNLDNRLSLSAFQTFLKTKLSCKVKVNAVPRSWRLRKDLFNFFLEVVTNTMKDSCNNMRCIGNLHCTSNYNTSGAAGEYIFCERNFNGRDVSFRAFLDYITRYFDYINPDGLFQPTISGNTQYHWTYEKEFSTLTSVSYEYTELKDLYRLGDVIYGIFASPHSDATSLHTVLPKGSAICQFTMDEVRQAFDGPFKKRLNNAWRPYDPREENPPVSPSPYQCDPDPISQKAADVEKMDIEFTDETLPLEKELQNFDLREESPRLNFFEKDVEGSRTMWKDASAEPIYTSLDTQYEKLQVELVRNVTILYLANVEGEIHKVITYPTDQEKNCWRPNATELEKWWREETNLHNNSWGRSYFLLNQEKETEGGKDFLFTSEWDCDKTSQHELLAVYKPFGDRKVKIWDMKLAKNKLVLGTDTGVQIIYTAQCNKYIHCSACAKDPHCGWSSAKRKCLRFNDGLIQNVKAPANCSSCLLLTKTFDPGEDLLLDTTLTLTQSQIPDHFQWYHNGSQITEKIGRYILTRNSSLYITDGRPEDTGDWELRDTKTNICMVTHKLSLSDCQTEKCLYDKQILNWKTEHDNWQEDMYNWHVTLLNSGCTDST